MNTSSNPELAESSDQLTDQGRKRFEALVNVLSELMLIASSFPGAREGVQSAVNTLLKEVLTIHPTLAVMAIDMATQAVLEAVAEAVAEDAVNEVMAGIDLSKINLDKSKPN